jgi:hypothetical protein
MRSEALGFEHRELTFVGILDSDSRAAHNPFLDNFRLADDPRGDESWLVDGPWVNLLLSSSGEP